MEPKKALWTGRFQPPTKAHMATVRAILEMWQSLEIVVSYEIPPPAYMLVAWADYVEASQNTSFGLGKNPFSPEEVQTMWIAGIEAAKLMPRVSISTNGRPEFDPNFIMRYPAHRYEFVLIELQENDSKIDAVHDDVLPRLHNRPVFRVRPSFKLHNSEIRKRVIEGGEEWSAYLPEGTLEAFLRVDGPARIIKSYKMTNAQK